MKSFFSPILTVSFGLLLISLIAGQLVNAATLEQLARKGDAGAQYLLGKQYLDGTRGKQDYAKAEDWFSRAAEKGHPGAIYGLAWVLASKAVTLSDEIRVAKLYRTAADQGIPGAQYDLAMYILNGKAGLEMNHETATDLLKKAADQNFVKAMTKLISMANKGQYPRDKGSIILYGLEQLAKKNHAAAQYAMGTIHEKGLIVPTDPQKALEWYKTAGGNGISGAYTRIGNFHHYGIGTPVDIQKAMKNYQTAIELGDFTANFYMGDIYEKGIEVEPDDRIAAGFYLEAARMGHLPSMAAYGSMLTLGRGVHKNDAAAYQWLEKAAQWGHMDAQYFLGLMYKQGLIPERPVEQPPDTSWRKRKHWKPGGFDRHWSQHWFKKAAAQGHMDAAKEIRRENLGRGWAFIAIGVFAVPFSILGFFFPEIVAQGRSPFLARFIGAPLCFLFGIYFLADGIRLVFF